MRLEYDVGCVNHGSLTVDGANFFDLGRDSQLRVFSILVEKCDEDGLYEMLARLLETQGEEKDLGRCAGCGDWCCRFTLETD